MQTTANENESDAWMQIASLLDAALAALWDAPVCTAGLRWGV